MNRMLTSILTITVVLGFAVHGIWAYNFGGVDSIDTNTGNVIDIMVNGQNPWSENYAIGPADPGYTGRINLTIRNIGNSPADLYLKLYNVTDSDVIRSEPEDKAEELIGEKHDISKRIRVGIDNGLDLDDKGILKDIAGQSINIGKIDIDDTVHMSITFHLEEDAGNEYQGDQSKFDISLSAIASEPSDKTEMSHISGGSDGNGCQGVITPEHSSNIALSETHNEDLVSGISIYYDYILYGNDIYQIHAADTKDEKCISIRTEILKNTSETTNKSAPGNVYKNINIWSGTDNIKEYSIRFKVEKVWGEKYSFPGDMKLFKWNKSTWEELDTKVINQDNKYSYFESHTNSYGVFAITRIRNDMDGGFIGYVPTPVPTNVEQHIPPKEQNYLWLLALIIGLIATVIYLAYKRRQII